MSSLFRSPSGKNNGGGGGSGKPSKDKSSGSRNPFRRKDTGDKPDKGSFRDRWQDGRESRLNRRDRGDELKRRKRREPDPTSDNADEGETNSARQKPSRKDRKRNKDGPATVDVDEHGNAKKSGGGKKKNRRKDRKNKGRDQQVSANKQAQRAEDASSIGGMDEDEPPSARHAANKPNSKRAPSEQDLRNDKGPKVAVVESYEEPRAPGQRLDSDPNRVENEVEAHRRRRAERQAARDVDDSPSSQDTGEPEEGNEGEMSDSANPYSKIPDPSSPQALKETLMGASNAAMQDAGFYEDRAEKNRAEARNLEDKGDVFSEAQQDFLRRASEDDETASNRRGQAAVYAEQSQNVRV